MGKQGKNLSLACIFELNHADNPKEIFLFLNQKPPQNSIILAHIINIITVDAGYKSMVI